MADVTDAAFRSIIAKYGKPDVMWTEFVSADGLVSAGKKKLLHNLKFSRKEKPIVAQLFSANPEKMYEAAKLVATMGFDGIDINMGCPDRTVEKQGSCAALIKNPKLAREIIEAARRGAPRLPISVKTRIGYNKNEIGTWIKFLLKMNLPALIVHLRTRRELSEVPAHWELMKKIVALKNKISPETLIIGNGDVMSLEQGRALAQKTGCDGVMLGRAIFGNPWLFSKKNSPKSSGRGRSSNEFEVRPRGDGFDLNVLENNLLINTDNEPINPDMKLKVLVEYTKLFEKLLGKHKNLAVMKKHFKAYVNGFDGAKELRVKLMETENAKQVEKIIKNFINK